jgi:PhzF family phenazine biosynthesis protein
MQFFWLDTFTSNAFHGNPTPICYLADDIESETMLSVAKEFNQPVTGFIKRLNAETFSIRYVTPAMEIPACGHATLAAAAVVAQAGELERVVFLTRNSNSIETVVKDGLVSMSYPKYKWKQARPSKELLESMGLEAYITAGICTELETLFIELKNAEALKGVSPDYQKMIASPDDIKEVVITSVSAEEGYDYLLRSFCPWIGIDEDPVTGSVQAALAPYWSARFNKRELKACQASERRGEFILDVKDDEVIINGTYFLAMKGEVNL